MDEGSAHTGCLLPASHCAKQSTRPVFFNPPRSVFGDETVKALRRLSSLLRVPQLGSGWAPSEHAVDCLTPEPMPASVQAPWGWERWGRTQYLYENHTRMIKTKEGLKPRFKNGLSTSDAERLAAPLIVQACARNYLIWSWQLSIISHNNVWSLWE